MRAFSQPAIIVVLACSKRRGICGAVTWGRIWVSNIQYSGGNGLSASKLGQSFYIYQRRRELGIFVVAIVI
jgi:hypothetical protein